MWLRLCRFTLLRLFGCVIVSKLTLKLTDAVLQRGNPYSVNNCPGHTGGNNGHRNHTYSQCFLILSSKYLSGRAGGFKCEPLKAAIDAHATRSLEPPKGG